MAADILGDDRQVHGDALRASDRGFSNLSLADYLQLLRWTAGQRVAGLSSEVLDTLSSTLRALGMEAGMWRELI